MDIEAYEYDVIASWRASNKLPRQVAVELHYDGYGTSDLTKMALQTNNLWPLHSMGLSDLSLFVSQGGCPYECPYESIYARSCVNQAYLCPFLGSFESTRATMMDFAFSLANSIAAMSPSTTLAT